MIVYLIQNTRLCDYILSLRNSSHHFISQDGAELMRELVEKYGNFNTGKDTKEVFHESDSEHGGQIIVRQIVVTNFKNHN